MTAAPQHSPLVEKMAFALWRDESIRSAARERTIEQWLDESEETRERWRRAARAALAACEFEECRELLLRSADGIRWWIDRFPGTASEADYEHLAEIDALLARLDGKA